MESTETKTIGVVVNGQPRRVPDGLNIVRLLACLEIQPPRVAVELNRQIVPKTLWDSTPVREGAQLEIVWFVGGGSA